MMAKYIKMIGSPSSDGPIEIAGVNNLKKIVSSKIGAAFEKMDLDNTIAKYESVEVKILQVTIPKSLRSRWNFWAVALISIAFSLISILKILAVAFQIMKLNETNNLSDFNNGVILDWSGRFEVYKAKIKSVYNEELWKISVVIPSLFIFLWASIGHLRYHSYRLMIKSLGVVHQNYKPVFLIFIFYFLFALNSGISSIRDGKNNDLSRQLFYLLGFFLVNKTRNHRTWKHLIIYLACYCLFIAVFLIVGDYTFSSWSMQDIGLDVSRSTLFSKISVLAEAESFPINNIKISNVNESTMSFLRSYIKLDIKNFENNSDEVLGILAHELGHVAYKDTLVQNIETSILVLQLPIFIQIVHLSEFFMGSVGLIGFDIPVEVGIPLAEVCSHFFIQYLKPLFLLYSRYSEYRADRHAVKLGYGQELYDALAKKSEKCDIFATPLYKFMSCTHPPIIERLVHLKECLSKSHST